MDDNDKLKFVFQPEEHLVLNFRYKNKELTVAFVRELIRKHLSSLTDEGLDLYQECLRLERLERHEKMNRFTGY